ncbi:MAG TPA: hypothetical protein VF530_21210 [Planctomycetota bacterium]
MRPATVEAVAVVLLGASCAATPAPLAFEEPEPWAEPIRDAHAAGERSFPDGFHRGITALQVFDGRLWIGYGDGTRNLGTVVPIEFRSFASPEDPEWRAAEVLGEGQGARQRTPTDTGEEQIEPYRVLDGALWQAGVDSNDPDEAWTQAKGPERVIEGNVFRLEGARWRKWRSIPGGEHVHDLAWHDGALWAVGSGADDRAEFEGGEVYRYLWRSDDGGRSFRTVVRERYPELGKGDTRFRRLLAVGDVLYVFGYVNPYVDGGPLEGRHLAVRGERIEPLVGSRDGPLAALVVQRTFALPDGTGLVVTRPEDGRTRAFRARADGFEELAGWARVRVIDVAVASDDELLVLTGDGGAPERCAVQRAALAELDALAPLLALAGEAPSALALWERRLFVGTAEGRILRARPASR